MRALLIANADDCDPGVVGQRFRHHGYAFTECHREAPGDWPTLDGVDLVVLLGSDWSVYWEHVSASVAAEAALVRETHRRGIPLFGVCFGAQMVAHALGGTVGRAPEPEIGWYDVATDRPELVESGPWMQWHSDRFTVPPGFTEVARSAVGPQAVVGGRTMATQFHPEATESIVSRWAAGDGADELVRAGLTPEALMAATRAATPRSRPACVRLVDAYLGSVVGSVPAETR